MSEQTPENDPVETPDDQETTESLEDFDAFWSSRKRKAKVTTIMGQRVQLPAALPLQFTLEAGRLQRSKSDRDIRKLLSILFGEDPVEAWAAAGMDLEQFHVLLAWAPQVIAGADVTLAQVAEALAKHEAASGKAPARTRKS